ncbi:MAG: YjbF family lipoprotein [Rhodospirillaceae bacterium]
MPIARFSLLVSLAILAGCSSGLSAVSQTVQEAYGLSSDVNPTLDPRFQYLRVTVRGRPAFLALGNEERTAGGPVKVWYSAKKEVLEFQNGRLVGASGLTTEWRKVSLIGLPSWRTVSATPGAVEWTRKRDVMPGYRYGVEDRLTLRRIETPRSTRLKSLDPGQLTWFEERMVSTDADLLPPAIYGVDMRDGRDEVVYGEQCLSPDLCFTWQKWPAK